MVDITSIRNISKKDIESLVAHRKPESSDIEYKRDLHLSSDGQKKEFLADVSSFANSSGGCLLFGIDAVDGIPCKAVGLADFEEDAMRLKIESLLRDGLDPKLTRIEMVAVPGFNRGPVLVLRVPSRNDLPHRVKLGGSSKFFARASAGKYEMDTREITQASQQAASSSQSLKQWCEDRIAAILSDATLPSPPLPSLVVHLVPRSALENESSISPSAMMRHLQTFAPIGVRGWDHKINAAGFRTYASASQAPDVCVAYTQLFKTGSVEAFRAGLAGQTQWHPRVIQGEALERSLVIAIRDYLSVLKSLNVQPPISLKACLLNAQGACVDQNDFHFPNRVHEIESEEVELAGVCLNEFPENVPKAIRPILDGFWNCCGFDGSPNFLSNGEWNLRIFGR